MTFTAKEQQFLAEAGIGRLATVSPDGIVQNNPTNYRVNADGTVDIGGMRMRASLKFRNVAAGSRVSFVIDQQLSLDPYVIRGIEIRGTAETLDDEEPRSHRRNARSSASTPNASSPGASTADPSTSPAAPRGNRAIAPIGASRPRAPGSAGGPVRCRRAPQDSRCAAHVVAG